MAHIGILWVWPPPSNSHHPIFVKSLLGNQEFATVTGRRPHRRDAKKNSKGTSAISWTIPLLDLRQKQRLIGHFGGDGTKWLTLHWTYGFLVWRTWIGPPTLQLHPIEPGPRCFFMEDIGNLGKSWFLEYKRNLAIEVLCMIRIGTCLSCLEGRFLASFALVFKKVDKHVFPPILYDPNESMEGLFYRHMCI